MRYRNDTKSNVLDQWMVTIVPFNTTGVYPGCHLSRLELPESMLRNIPMWYRNDTKSNVLGQWMVTTLQVVALVITVKLGKYLQDVAMSMLRIPFLVQINRSNIADCDQR